MIKNWSVYLVTEESLSTKSTLEVVSEAIKGGIDVIQLRDKGLTMRERYVIGKELRRMTRAANIELIVNNDVDLAIAIDADGVHIGQDDLPIDEVRRLIGPSKIIGLTTGNIDEMVEAESKGADYIGIGAIYGTSSKDLPDRKKSIGLDILAEAKKRLSIPIVAIGGISHSNAREVIRAGGDCVAVISAITASNNIEEATRALKNVVEIEKDSK